MMEGRLGQGSGWAESGRSGGEGAGWYGYKECGGDGALGCGSIRVLWQSTPTCRCGMKPSKLRARSTVPATLQRFQGLKAAPWPRNISITSEIRLLRYEMAKHESDTMKDNTCRFVCVLISIPRKHRS